MRTIRTLAWVFAAILVLLAGGVIFLFDTKAEAAAGGLAYTSSEYVLTGEPLEGAKDTPASIGYRAYLPKKKKSNHIVILVSGWTCGPAWLHYAAACLAGQHGVEVWTVKRRMAFFEDRAAWADDIKRLRPGTERREPLQSERMRLQSAANYFKGNDPHILNNIGYGILLDDIDVIVRAAASKKQPVVLGGWSDGVEYVMAYAHRQFADGRRGHERLSGLVFLDENPEWGTYSPQSMRQELTKKRALAGSEVYEKRWPEVTVFEALGALVAADMRPGGEAALAGAPGPVTRRQPADAFDESTNAMPQAESILSSFFPQRPRARLTEAALLGWLYSGSGYASGWSWLVSAGSFDDTKTPVAWKDGGNTPLERLAAIHTLPDGVWEWFYPHRIAVDYWEIGISGFRHEGLRIAPDENNRLPVFAVLSEFNRFPNAGTPPAGSMEKGAGIPPGIRWWIERTGIRQEHITLLKFDHFRHADILLSPRAEEQIYAPLARWLDTLPQTKGKK